MLTAARPARLWTRTIKDNRELNVKLFQQHAALPFTMRDGALWVLLVTSRETRRWIIPKGWPEKNLKGYEVAQREALEEAGVIGKIAKKPFASFRYLKWISETKHRRCIVDVFPLAVQRELDDWPEKTQRERKWMPPSQAALLVTETGLIELFLTLSEGAPPLSSRAGGDDN